MTTVAVVIPWLGDGGRRDLDLAWVRRWWAAHHPDWPVVLGQAPAGPWCKADALAAGLAQVDTDVVVVADGDMFTTGVPAAVAAATRCGWAVPHRLLHRLTEPATDTLLAADPAGITRPPVLDLTEPAYRGFAGGSMVVLTREVLDQVPMDRRFTGWGQQDESWAMALTTLVGPCWRGAADIWHLWHPPQQRMTRRWGSPANQALRARYRNALRRPAVMRSLLAEIPAPARR